MDPPHSSKTNGPISTKIGKGWLRRDMTRYAKFGLGRSRGVGAVGAQSACDSRFFSFFCFFDTRTAQTAEPIFMVNSSNDVFSPKVRPFWGLIAPSLILWAWLPKNPLFGPFFEQTRFATRSGLKSTYKPNHWTDFSHQGLKSRDSIPTTASSKLDPPNPSGELTAP